MINEETAEPEKMIRIPRNVQSFGRAMIVIPAIIALPTNSAKSAGFDENSAVLILEMCGSESKTIRLDLRPQSPK